MNPPQAIEPIEHVAAPRASVHDFAAVESWRRRRKLDRQFVRRLRIAFYKQAAASRSPALAELPEEHRASFAGAFELHPLRLVSRHDSAVDGATKLLFRTASAVCCWKP